MNVRHDTAAPVDEQAVAGGRVHQPDPADGPRSATGPALVNAADPRLAHAGAAAPRLMALQRSAGNAAVASLVGGSSAVQRAVTIDEMSVEAPETPEGPAVDAAASAAGATGGASGAVTSDGATTTINGATITLAAPLTTANGVLRADTIIADNVVASSYTPGAGNVW